MGIIQAIPTIYKGYRFRSRLEARWAVFLDKMEIDWIHELEGASLPSSGYLCDLHLTRMRTYIEVKAPPFTFTGWPKVYLAGRMSQENCYRTFNIDGCRGLTETSIRPRKLINAHIHYVGPYRNMDDHTGGTRQHDTARSGHLDHIIDRSFDGIACCQIFFALFEDLEAYGTLVELGYAAALNKRIILGFTQPARWDGEPTKEHEEWIAPDKDDHRGNLWFALRAAEKCFGGTCEEILNQFSDWLCQEYPLPREQQLAWELAQQTGETVTVVYGDPYGVLIDRDDRQCGLSEVGPWEVKDPGQSFLFNLDREKLKSAALAARQARFEHGETP